MEHSLTFSASKHKKRWLIRLMVGKENQTHHYATVGHGSHNHKDQILGGLSQQTMMGPMKDLNVTTGLRNRVAKI
jgi:hypothetical protein